VTNPKGVGIKFRSLDRGQRRQLRALTRRLRRATIMARKERYLINQDSFLKKLNENSESDSNSQSYNESRS
jgi:hypothetical protein